jgi:hypothetical protein
VPGGTEGGTTSTRPRCGLRPARRRQRGKAAGNARVGNRQDAVRRDANLRADLREFVSARPRGWNHDQWLGLLDDLRGAATTLRRFRDRMSLERERLAAQLEQIAGMVRAAWSRWWGRYHNPLLPAPGRRLRTGRAARDEPGPAERGISSSPDPSRIAPSLSAGRGRFHSSTASHTDSTTPLCKDRTAYSHAEALRRWREKEKSCGLSCVSRSA